MMTLIKEDKDKLAQCSYERNKIEDGGFNENSCLREEYSSLTIQIIELKARLNVYNGLIDKLIAYFTTNA